MAGPTLVGSACAPIQQDAAALDGETLVGEADDEQTFVAVIRDGTQFMVYACDDEHDAWFRAQSFVSNMDFANAAGDSVSISLREGGEAFGAITFAGLEPITFHLEATDAEVLFRAEDSIGGERVLGGWIVLPNGEQRGVVLRGRDKVTSRVVDRTPDVLPGRLTPTAFTPQALASPTRARARRFELFGLGDSYGAGEGAPETPGRFEDDGSLGRGGRRPVWNNSLTDSSAIREAEACHRSGVSGIEIAADLLAADYPGALDMRLTPLACSGAQTEHLLSCAYRGAIGDHFETPAEFQRPQLERVETAARRNGADAVYMSIGGNDMRFGFLLGNCFKDGLGPANDCGPGSPVETAFLQAIARMPTQYRAIRDRLRRLSVPSDAVYLSQAPNPLLDARGEPCAEIDVFRHFGFLRVDAENTTWLAEEIVPTMNRTFADAAAANGWNLVNSHIETFLGHGYCSSDSWFVDNPTSLRTQGRAMTDALNSGDFPLDTCIAVPETYAEVGPVRPATVGPSIVHPNHAGYRQGYGPAIAEAMRAQVEDHVRPTPVAALRIQAQPRTNVVLAWTDTASTETEYRVRLVYQEGAGLPGNETITLPADSRTIEITLPARARGTAEVRPCYVVTSPARRELCGEVRSIAWSNIAPVTVIGDFRIDTSRAAIARPSEFREFVAHQEVRAVWTASREVGVVFYELEITRRDGSVEQLTTTSDSMRVDANVQSARVRACNFVGCSDYSRPSTGPNCEAGQVVTSTGMCVPSQRFEPSTRDIACRTEIGRAGSTPDPGGLCSRQPR
jgi:hypothetical protein